MRGGAHTEHPVHVRDAGRVEAQRLIEGRRVLPRSKAGRVMLGEVCGPEGGGAKGRGAAAGARGALAEDPRLGSCGGRVRAAERTRNMACIHVTLDVSKLSGWLNFAASCRVESRACDARRGVRARRRGS